MGFVETEEPDQEHVPGLPQPFDDTFQCPLYVGSDAVEHVFHAPISFLGSAIAVAMTYILYNKIIKKQRSR